MKLQQGSKMADSHSSFGKKLIENYFKKTAQLYIKIKKPTVICVAGSVGKTSTKLMIGQLLASRYRVSYMDDSYNTGLGLYMSVFKLKVPNSKRDIFGWISCILKSLGQFLRKSPEFIVLEYGIDHPGDMDNMTSFIQPDVSVLTAALPEHMEFMKTMDNVGREEAKILKAAKNLAFVNAVDVDGRFVKNISSEGYGTKSSGNFYIIKDIDKYGSLVDFMIGGVSIKNVKTKFISEALIRQLCGAILVAYSLGVDSESIKYTVQSIEPAAGRMMLLEGLNNSTIIDDSANFSPEAGIVSLKTMKKIPAKKHIAILGNMHELGDYEAKGYADVSREFTDIDTLILIGDLSIKYFSPLAKKMGFNENKNLFYFNDSISAGQFVRDKMSINDSAILVKGPFGGYYLEEVSRMLLANPKEINKLTRQSEFWFRKKQQVFGKDYRSL